MDKMLEESLDDWMNKHIETHDEFDIFMEAYQRHKEKYGSFKHLRDKEYKIKMANRVEYQKDCVEAYKRGDMIPEP